jgi:predicted alpha/beta superfamily hydrolase
MRLPFHSSRRAAAIAVLSAAAALTNEARAQAAPPADPVPAHDTFTVVSRVLAEKRPINVYLPRAYKISVTAKLPVLYMPDGAIDEDFPHIVNTVDSLINLGVIRPVIVVGIPNTERRRDLTGPTRIKEDSAIAPHVGGSAAFRQFIRDELFPAVKSRYRVTDERAIVGESLAGLFIVETFLMQPAMFDHYVAIDPSLWWNSYALTDASPSYVTALGSSPRTLYIASADSKEISGASARLVAALGAAPKSIVVTYEPRKDLTHATIFRAVGPGALAKALR